MSKNPYISFGDLFDSFKRATRKKLKEVFGRALLSWRTSKITFFFQVFAIFGCFWVVLIIAPVVISHIPYIENILNLPQPFMSLAIVALAVLTKIIASVTSEIQVSRLFTFNLPLTLAVILVEILVVVGFHLFKKPAKDLLKYAK